MKPKIYLTKRTHIANFGNEQLSDTGFCNRLLLWDMIQSINKRNRYQHEIYLIEQDNPEKQYVVLPNTKYITEIPVGITNKISFNDYKKIVKNGDVFPNQTFIIDFGVEKIHYHMEESFQETSTNQIIPKSQKLNFLINNHANEYVGIHIRRFNGVSHRKDYLKYFPNKQKKILESIVLKKEKLKYELPFIDDSFYFHSIENIIKKSNRKIKFYISHDMPDYFYDYYKQKFGDDIIYTRADFYTKLPKLNQQQKNVFDLFFLANTKYKILSNGSSWSYFAQIYNQNSVFSYLDIEEEFYHNFIN